MAKTYLEKLQDPRWQKKRLEIMERAEFSCECCGDKENTLNVHHKEYLKGHEPWEYELNQLVCLCQDCHEIMHSTNYALKYVISRLPIDHMFDRMDVSFIIGGAIQIPYEKLLTLNDVSDNEYFKTRYIAGESLPDFIGFIYKNLKEKK